MERRQHRGDIDNPKSQAAGRVRQIRGLAHELLRYGAGKGSDEFMFRRKDGELIDDRDLQQHVFRPAAEAAGIYVSGFGMHRLKALNATWRQEVGATPIEAQKQAEHASLNMTFLYTQTEEERGSEHVGRILGRLSLGKSSEPEALASMEPKCGIR